jgi:3-isopropylmalate dehydratase small subunit
MEAGSMSELIQGKAYLLGDDVNTDLHCSSKYMPGKDNGYIAAHAFNQLVPGFADRFVAGGIIVAGKHFGINSSREQAVHVMRLMGVKGIVAKSFGRQFFRNAINNGLPVMECDLDGIAGQDDIQLDLANGLIEVPARAMRCEAGALPEEIRAILAAGGLIPFLAKYPNWEITQ